MAFFVRALPPGRVGAVKAAVEGAAAGHAPTRSDDDWATYWAFLECLDKRAAKVRRPAGLLAGWQAGCGGVVRRLDG